MTPKTEKVYFKNLHGFRFFAASLVIFTHLELFKRRAGLENWWDKPFFFEAGSAGVDFFFVLSGFLITSLLLVEREKKGRIDLKKFYMRRVLRIWPLYYLILLLCYFLIPHLDLFYFNGYSEGIQENFWQKFLLSFFFLPNAALAFYPNIPYAAPLWSIGVEEQFYLFWPLIIMLLPRRMYIYLLFIIFFISIKVVLLLLNKFNLFEPDFYEKLKYFIVATRMECMGIGCLGAWLVYKKNTYIKIFSSNLVCVLSITLLPLVFYFAKYLFELHHILFSICFLLIILNGATNPKTFFNLEKPFFVTMGNISYGLYLWHMIWIGFVLNLLLKWQEFSGSEWYFNLILYFGAFILSIFCAWLSYKFFETPFLNFKKKYAVVVSGLEARKSKISRA